MLPGGGGLSTRNRPGPGARRTLGRASADRTPVGMLRATSSPPIAALAADGDSALAVAGGRTATDGRSAFAIPPGR